MRHLRLFVGALTVAVELLPCTGVGAQESPTAPSPRPIAESAERLAHELWPIEVDEQGRPRFRAGVTIQRFVLPLPWVDPEAQPSLFRPRGGSLLHHQFLEAVTPEAFRASTLFPIGITVDPGAMYQDFKAMWRRWQEQRVRARVAKELEEFRARIPPEPR